MTKIVYNKIYNGFSLSDEGLELYAKLKGIVLYKERDEYFSDYYTSKDLDENSYFPRHNLPQTDPDLIKVIETLGPKANGDFSDLEIVDLPPGTKYRIDEYDGNERIMTIDDYDWKIT